MFKAMKAKLVASEIKQGIAHARAVLKDPELRIEVASFIIELIEVGKLMNTELNKLDAKDRAAKRICERIVMHKGECPMCENKSVTLEGARVSQYSSPDYGQFVCADCGHTMYLTSLDYKVLKMKLPALEKKES